jgi:hypothetical protein
VAEQVRVVVGIAVDAASGLVDDRLIPEVASQSVVVRCEGSGAAHDCQSQNVGVVRRANAVGEKAPFFQVKLFSID